MKRSVLFTTLAATLLLSACAESAYRLPSTAVMPPGALQTNGDVDVRALDIAAYGFGHWQEMVGNPALAAETVASLDYMAGKLNTAPRWVSMPAIFRMNMLTAREQVRAQLGIGREVPSQQVVDALIGLAAAYRAGDQAQVQRLLAEPIFTLGPQETAQRLANLPYMPAVNNATTHADGYAFDYNFPG
ncbi:MAG TPA: hypothetical protein VL752_14200 [Acidisoma sp.]|uniref:hypothetical protein n=1 Tax=Acidisoma sp. TaxID=1872115 RepID=UPI002BFD1168|nr:hypothetical protein [Acidisoma sp.]HTI02096.1 hypothetical protein [Acidisoma sp.]